MVLVLRAWSLLDGSIPFPPFRMKYIFWPYPVINPKLSPCCSLSPAVSCFQGQWTLYPPGFAEQRKQYKTNTSFRAVWVLHILTHMLTVECVCLCMWVCMLACLLYNNHWSKTGPSCQATAVTTNNDYPLPAPESSLHNHQHRGDPPLLGEQCIHEWASSSPKPTLISPLRARQTPSLCVYVCVDTY